MILHKNKTLFRNLVAKTADDLNLDESIVLKDYYVVLVLKILFSQMQNLVFIGGTSLSKCFNLIQRFSEDIDIVAIGEKRRQKQKLTTNAVEVLQKFWDSAIENDNDVFSDFKEAYLSYETHQKSTLDQRVKLELITFTDPFPTILKQVKTLISQSMSREEIRNYKMHAIKVRTQEPYRTMVEKIVLEKEIYKDIQAGLNPSETHTKRARDFYDIHKIFEYYQNSIPFNKNEFLRMIESRASHRRNRTTIKAEEFNDLSLHRIFKEQKIAHQLNTIDKEKLSIRDLDTDQIENSLIQLDGLLSEILK